MSKNKWVISKGAKTPSWSNHNSMNDEEIEKFASDIAKDIDTIHENSKNRSGKFLGLYNYFKERPNTISIEIDSPEMMAVKILSIGDIEEFLFSICSSLDINRKSIEFRIVIDNEKNRIDGVEYTIIKESEEYKHHKIISSLINMGLDVITPVLSNNYKKLLSLINNKTDNYKSAKANLFNDLNDIMNDAGTDLEYDWDEHTMGEA